MKNFFTLRSILLIALFTTLAIGGRMVLLDLPNIEPIMAMSVLAGALLGPVAGLVVALVAVVSTDLMIGNTSIMLYTWSAWALIGLSSTLAKRRNKQTVKVWRDTAKVTGWGLLGTLFFYLWTNFGVWQIGEWYPHTWAGLLQSYTLALPFLRNHLISSLTIVPAASLITFTVWKYAPVFLRNRLKNRSAVSTPQ